MRKFDNVHIQTCVLMFFTIDTTDYESLLYLAGTEPDRYSRNDLNPRRSEERALPGATINGNLWAHVVVITASDDLVDK